MRNLVFTVVLLGSSSVATSFAWAGPCSDDIATVGRSLSSSASLGPVTTGTVSGTAPKTAATSAAPATAGTSADNKVGGTAGTKEMTAAAGEIATSPADVRRQQEGLPLAAAATGGQNGTETAPGSKPAGSASDATSQAKMALENARDLDAKGDPSCKEAVQRARKLINAS